MRPPLDAFVDAQHHRSNSADALRSPDPADHPHHTGWPEWTTLFLYSGLVAFAIPYHEPFVDEAQAWQLARSLSLPALFVKFIRYEGTPGLWHFLLWILTRIHVSYSGLHWLCGATAVVATSLLIFRSPFPRYLKLLLPFTYFLLFQYAIIARSYILVPLLLYLVAICWKKNPAWIALLLGLLANVALHAAIISGGLAIVYLIAQIREGAHHDSALRRKLLLSATLLFCFYAFAIWTAWPPHDLSVSRAIGGSHSFLAFAIASLVMGTCQPWILSILFWIAIALCLTARRSFFYLIPVLFFSIFSGAVYATFWQMGLLVPLVICLLWITWPEAAASPAKFEIPGRAALAFLIAVQILWSAYAIRYDHDHAYSPDLATAQFLKPLVREGDTIAITYISNPADHAFLNHPQDYNYLSIGILPYFSHNIFVNQPYPFWLWGEHDPAEKLFLAELPSRPPIILAEVVQHTPAPINLNNPKVKLLTQDGYRLTNIFCGTMPQRMELAVRSCHLIFQSSTDKPTALQTKSVPSRPGT